MLKKLFAACLLLLSALAFANEQAPDALIKQVSTDVLNVIKTDKDIQAGNLRKVNELVDTKILPYVNMQRITALAVGQDWRKATPEQKVRLADEFKVLLVRTYANALVAYKNATIEVKPLKMAAGETDVLVKSLVKTGSGEPVALDYSLQMKEGSWKIYDVVVAGVSLVTNYRDTFMQEIRAGGIDGLIQTLANKNKQGALPGAKK